MEKFKRIQTHNLLFERCNDLEDSFRPVCYRIFLKNVDDSDILMGSAEIVSVDVDIKHNGKVERKEKHFSFEVNVFEFGEMHVVYDTDLGIAKNGLPDDGQLQKLVDVACDIILEHSAEEAISNYNHGEFLKLLGFPFSVAVRLDNNGKEEENGLFYVVNCNYDVICESAALAQAQTIRDALNAYTNREIF